MNEKTAGQTATDTQADEAEIEESEKSKDKNDIVTLVKDLVGIVVFYFIFTWFAWGAFHIPSGSMEPTLEVGDRIFVSKFAYGYNRFSFSFDPEFIGEDRMFDSAPDRGDVVVFTLPYKDDTDFIKRVVGMPGDTIKLEEGRLYINGKIVPRKFIREVNYTNYQGKDVRAKEYEETLPGGVKHRIYEQTDNGVYDRTRTFRVPADHYFMMGDNRDASSDSRAVGTNPMSYVHKKYLVGRADITTFSLYDCDQGKDVGCVIGIPYGRFFNGIE